MVMLTGFRNRVEPLDCSRYLTDCVGGLGLGPGLFHYSGVISA